MRRVQIRPSEASKAATQFIVGATESVEICANLGFAFTHVLTRLRIEDLLAVADPRLRLRCVLGLPLTERREFASRYLEAFQSSEFRHALEAWDARLVEQWSGEHFIIIDKKIALVSRPTARVSPSAINLVNRAKEVDRLFNHFESFWEEAAALNLIYVKEEEVTDAQSADVLIVSQERWDYLIRILANNPEIMRELPPTRFEELVAELLNRDGLQVVLTPRVSDGGRDILACMDTPVGNHLYLVECKRYAPHRPVGVELVRQLYGVVDYERATAGLLVTTSSFTAGAKALQQDLRYRLGLRDYEDLIVWLRRTIAV